MMQMKYIRFFTVETQFRTKFIILFAFLILSFIFGKILSGQNQVFEKVKEEKGLVDRIGQMEQVIIAKTRKMPKPRKEIKIASKHLNLQGTSIQKGIPRALINGNIVEEGDIIHGYTVKNVKIGYVMLENQKSNARQELYFEYFR